MKHFLLAAALMTATSPAYAIVNTKECAAIRAYNAKAAFDGGHEISAVPLHPNGGAR
jgi:hypothetical protein